MTINPIYSLYDPTEEQRSYILSASSLRRGQVLLGAAPPCTASRSCMCRWRTSPAARVMSRRCRTAGGCRSWAPCSPSSTRVGASGYTSTWTSGTAGTAPSSGAGSVRPPPSSSAHPRPSARSSGSKGRRPSTSCPRPGCSTTTCASAAGACSSCEYSRQLNWELLPAGLLLPRTLASIVNRRCPR